MDALEKSIIEYQRNKWVLIARTNSTAQMRKPKRGFSCLPNLLWTIIGIIGIGLVAVGFIPGIILVLLGVGMPIIYFIGYVLGSMGKEKIITLFMDEKGTITRK